MTNIDKESSLIYTGTNSTAFLVVDNFMSQKIRKHMSTSGDSAAECVLPK